jgi:hypothetical protein
MFAQALNLETLNEDGNVYPLPRKQLSSWQLCRLLKKSLEKGKHRKHNKIRQHTKLC